MDAFDMERTLVFTRRLPSWNPYDHVGTVVISAPDLQREREAASRSAVTVRSQRREQELRAIVHRVFFAVGFVTTGMSIGAALGLLVVRLYS